MKEVVTKFGSLKIDSVANTTMSSDAKYQLTTNNEIYKLSSLCFTIRTHRCICTVIIC